MTNFTQGTWNDKYTHQSDYIRVSGKTGTVALIPFATNPNAKKDARLIASAPELLAALKVIDADMPLPDWMQSIVTQAIANAEAV